MPVPCTRAVKKAGGEPVVVNAHLGRSAEEDMKGVNALIMLGNDYDIDPGEYGEEISVHTHSERLIPSPDMQQSVTARADYEREALKIALERRIPILGICGGMQRINVALGGSLHQEITELGIATHKPPKANMVIVRTVEAVPGSQLSLIGEETQRAVVPAPGVRQAPGTVQTNNSHHQAVNRLGRGLVASAYYDETYADPVTHAPRKLIAALEPDPNGAYAGRCILGVQWHPELSMGAWKEKLFGHLVEQARAYAATAQNGQAPTPVVAESDLLTLPHTARTGSAPSADRPTFTR